MKKLLALFLSLALLACFAACGNGGAASSEASVPEETPPASSAASEAGGDTETSPAPAPDNQTETEPEENTNTPEQPQEQEQEDPMPTQIYVTFNGHTYTATLADNSSVRAFVQLMQENGGSVTVNAHDYGSFEKVGPLGASIATNDEPINTTAGDIILYQGSNVCLYYAENSWNFTRLGKLDGDLSALRGDLGNGDVDIVYSLGN